MEFETGRRSTLARLQLSVQGLAGSLNSAKKVLVASTVLTAAFCGAVFGLTLVANEASKESHVENGVLIATDGQSVKTTENKGFKSISELSAWEIATQDFVSFSQDGADRYMQILGVQATASKKVINTIVGAFEVTEEGLTFAGDNVVLEATEADKAARKAQCKFCEAGGRNTNCIMCSQGAGRSFAVAGRNAMCVVCNAGSRNLQCTVCHAGRAGQCKICQQGGRAGQCRVCQQSRGRNSQCIFCEQGRSVQCKFCSSGRNAQESDWDFDCDSTPDKVFGYIGANDTEDNLEGTNWDVQPDGYDAMGNVKRAVINGKTDPANIEGSLIPDVTDCMSNGLQSYDTVLGEAGFGSCYGNE